MPMKIAMSVLALGAIVGGVLQIPGVDRGVQRFLEPTFADSIIARHDPSTTADWIGLAIGAVIAIAGIAIAYRIWVLRPGDRARAAEALRGDPHVPLEQVVLRRADRPR